jgi:hypothetical protein
VGVAVRGTGVTEMVGDGLGEGEGEGDGLADGAANCCEEITAAPRSSSATRARAANTLKTVDQRSAGRRSPGTGPGGATLVWGGGGVICSVSSRVASASARFLGLSSTKRHDRMPRAERSDTWLLALVVSVAVLSACGSPVAAAPPVDCGSFDAGHGEYDRTGHECIWSAYTAGTAVTYRSRHLTIEGDPIPMTLSFEPGRGIRVTRDVTADNFSSHGDRRVWAWTCSTMAKRTWATDASRYSFDLTGCTGDGPNTHFP